VLIEAVDRTVGEAQATDGTFMVPALTTAVFVAAEN
jgi:hypothetical protein